jgi:hypothetical protein
MAVRATRLHACGIFYGRQRPVLLGTSHCIDQAPMAKMEGHLVRSQTSLLHVWAETPVASGGNPWGVDLGYAGDDPVGEGLVVSAGQAGK